MRAYLFCFWIVRLALRVCKAALEFGLSFLLLRFVEYFFALSFVFNRPGLESVCVRHRGEMARAVMPVNPSIYAI